MAESAKQWEERIRHARLVWEEAGLDEESGVVPTWYESYGNEARGVSWQGLMQNDLVKSNVFASSINAMNAAVYARNPQFEAFTANPRRKDAGNKVEKIINFAVVNPALQMKTQWNQALFDASIGYFGVVRHGFTQSDEKFTKNALELDFYDPAIPGFPWIQRLNPMTEFLCDPMAGSLNPRSAVRWCAFRRLLRIDRAKKIYNSRKDIKADFVPKLAHERRRQAPAGDKIAEFWHIYDKEDRQTYVWSPGLRDGFVKDAEDWPIDWPTLPYSVLQFNPVPGTLFGTSFSSMVLPLQAELNKTLTIANKLTQSLRRVVPIDKTMLADGEDKKLERLGLMEVLLLEGDVRNAIGQIQLGGLPQELLAYIQFLIGQIREVLGISEFQRAQRINVETAAEVGQVAAGAASQLGRIQGPWEEFLSETMSLWTKAFQAVKQGESFSVPVLGNEDASSLFGSARSEDVAPDEIEGEFLIRARPGSSLARDPSQDIREQIAFNQSMKDFGELVNWPQAAMDTTRAFKKDPAKQLQSPQGIQQTQQVTNARAPLGEQGQQPPQQPINPALLEQLRERQ